MSVEQTTPESVVVADSSTSATVDGADGVDVTLLLQRIRQLEHRLLSRDPITGWAPLADEAPETACVAAAKAAMGRAVGGNAGQELQSESNDLPENAGEQHQHAESKESDKDGDGDGDAAAAAGKPLLLRVTSLNDRLNDQVTRRQALKDLWAKYEACRAYLAPSKPSERAVSPPKDAPPAADSNGSTANEGDSAITAPVSEAQFERTILAADARAEILAEATSDWTRVCAQLQEAAGAQDSLNPPEFQQMPKLLPRLTAVSNTSQEQIVQSKELERKVDTLLAGYNDTIHTLSELFLHWDGMLNDLEARVAAAERRR